MIVAAHYSFRQGVLHNNKLLRLLALFGLATLFDSATAWLFERLQKNNMFIRYVRQTHSLKNIILTFYWIVWLDDDALKACWGGSILPCFSSSLGSRSLLPFCLYGYTGPLSNCKWLRGENSGEFKWLRVLLFLFLWSAPSCHHLSSEFIFYPSLMW